MGPVSTFLYRLWRLITSLLTITAFVCVFVVEVSPSVSLSAIAAALLVGFAPLLAGRIQREAGSGHDDGHGRPIAPKLRAGDSPGNYRGWRLRLLEWTDRVSDWSLARARFKHPVRAIAAAYRAATIEAERSGNQSPEILRNALQQWSLSGAYDDPDSPRVRPAYDAWNLRMSQRTFQREIRRLYREGAWRPKVQAPGWPF